MQEQRLSPEIAPQNHEQYNLGAFMCIMTQDKYLLIREHVETVKDGEAKYGAIGGRAAFDHLPVATSAHVGVQIGALEADQVVTRQRDSLLSYLGIRYEDIVPWEGTVSRHQLRFNLSPSQATKLHELLKGPQPILDLSPTAITELIEELCEENRLLSKDDIRTAVLEYRGQWEDQKKSSDKSKKNPHHLRSIYTVTFPEDITDKLLMAVEKSNGVLILATAEEINNGKTVDDKKIDWKTVCILPPESPSTTT